MNVKRTFENGSASRKRPLPCCRPVFVHWKRSWLTATSLFRTSRVNSLLYALGVLDLSLTCIFAFSIVCVGLQLKDEFEEEITRRRGEIDATRAEFDSQLRSLNEEREGLAARELELAERQRAIEAETAQRQQQWSEGSQRLDERASQLAQLEADCRAREEQLQQHQAELRERETQNEKRERVCAGLEQQCEEKLRQHELAQQQLQSQQDELQAKLEVADNREAKLLKLKQMIETQVRVCASFAALLDCHWL